MTLRQKFSSEEISGFLDQGTSVTGELQFSGTMRVDGEFHGSISTNDKLIIGERAQVHADVQAGEIEIFPDQGIAKNLVLRVNNTPVLYLPYLCQVNIHLMIFS